MYVEDDLINFRTVTIGDSSVGKTSVVNRFIHDRFDQNEPNTVGPLYDSYKEEHDGHTVEVQIWDTAGQEQYRSLGPVYFRMAAAALIVFDLTNANSFRNVNDWLSSFRNNTTGDNTVVVLVGNKCDLLEDRQVTEQEGRDWALQNHAFYCETSAKTGFGVKDLFRLLIDELLKANVEETSQNIQSVLKDKQQKEKKDGCC